jgi:MtrB/PioB family decaheme-associated outer membrane protein
MEVRSTVRGLALLAGCSLAAAATPARADVVDAEIWAGGRTISGDTSSSKFNEYRDLEPGGFGGANFLVEDPNGVTFLWGDFDNVGYDNQSYSLEAGQWGRLRLFGEYSELPHIFSNDARSLYISQGSNYLNFPDALQSAIQAAPTSAAKSDLLRTNLGNVPRTSLDYQLRTIVGGLIFDPREDLELETAYRQLQRSGRRPFGMGFGSPGGNFANFAAPIDEQTNEVTADARFGRGPWNLQVGYLGSFFDNDLNQVTADNPLRLTDQALQISTAGALSSAPSQGRLALSPDNSLNNFHATGAYDLPLEFPARVATTFSYGLRQQDQDFLPHTINSVLAGAAPGLALPQDSLDGKVQTYLANVLMTARPLPELDLRARYRYYDFHNDTPVISFPGHVVNDQAADDEIVRNVPNSYERQQASFDASYRFSRAVTVRGGPFWDQWSRSRDREVSRLDEYGAKLAADLRPTSWALVRADYLFGDRNGTQYDPYDHLAATLDPGQLDEPDFSSVGQLAQLRKFDEANRIRNEVKLLTQLMPRDDLDLSFSGGFAYYDYPQSSYGVLDDERWNLGTELGYQPVEWFSMSAWYSFEHMKLSQKSRWRPVSGTTVTDDPVNNWSSESIDLVHTLGATLDFVLVPDKLDLSFSYTFERGNGETHSNGAAGCVPAPVTGVCLPPPGTAADGGDAVNYPDIEDRLQIFATTLSYHFTEHFTLQGFYAFEKLAMQDFRVDGLNPFMPASNVNGSGVVSPSLDVFLGDQVGGYDAHIFGLTASYKF